MEFWNHIVNTALLGTDKRFVNQDELPDSMAAVLQVINEGNTTDKESRFLDIASVANNYRKCGIAPVKRDDFSLAVAEAELLPYCSLEAAEILKNVIECGSVALLNKWVGYAANKMLIVPPELAPALLNLIAGQKSLTNALQLKQVCGKRGEWLGSLNKEWSLQRNDSIEEQWIHEKEEHRKQILQTIRASEPAKARDMLISTWKEETAAAKFELLTTLRTNAGADDVAWLESLSTEKSKKVAEEAIAQLKLIPESTIVRQYKEIAGHALIVKKDKGIFGFGAKTSLAVQFPLNTPEAVFETGIRKTSPDSNFTDEEYVLFQLMDWVPLQFWEQKLEMGPAAIVSLLLKEATTAKYFKSIANQALKSKAINWATPILESGQPYMIELVNLLPEPQREKYFLANFGHLQEVIINFAKLYKNEWSQQFAENILNHTLSLPYQYGTQFYNEVVILIPTTAIPFIMDFQVQDKYAGRMLENIKTNLLKLIHLKQSIDTIFNK